MFYKFSKSLLLITVLFVVGCGKNNIEMVQQASPSSYPNITYKQLLENHNEFSSYTWEEIKTERGEKAIQFTGKYKEDLLQKLYKNRIFIAQFDLNTNGDGFTVGYFGNNLEIINQNIADQFNLKEVINSPLNTESVLEVMYNHESIFSLKDSGPDDIALRTVVFTKLIDFASQLDSVKFKSLLEVRGKDIDTIIGKDFYVGHELSLNDKMKEYLCDENNTEKGKLLFSFLEKLIELYPKTIANFNVSNDLAISENGDVTYYDSSLNNKLMPIARSFLDKLKE